MGNINGALLSQQIDGSTTLHHDNQDFPANVVSIERPSSEEKLSNMNISFKDDAGRINHLIITPKLVTLNGSNLDPPHTQREWSNQVWIHWDNTRSLLLVSYGPIDMRDTRNCYRYIFNEDNLRQPVYYRINVNGKCQVKIGHMDQFKCYNESCKQNWGIGPSNNSVQTNCAYFHLVDQQGNKSDIKPTNKLVAARISDQSYDQAYQERANPKQNALYTNLWFILLFVVIILVGIILYIFLFPNNKSDKTHSNPSGLEKREENDYIDGIIGILPMSPINI